ncbi:MAG: hypothetical protein RR744_00255 [Cellulosilyticaceae bacterium]
MKAELKLKYMEGFMAKASRLNKRGRKGMQVTEDIINDLMEIEKDEFIKKYRCTENAYLKLYYDFTSFVNDEEEKAEDEEVKEVIQEQKPVVIIEDLFKGIFPEVEYLYEKGLKEYREKMKENQSKYDSQIADILHKMELTEVSQPEKIALYDMMTEARRNRRKWGNCYEFLIDNNGSNSHKVIDYLNLRKIVESYKRKLENRVYGTRVLKEELGEVICGEKK